MRGILNARHILNQHDLQMPEPMELGRNRKLRVSPLVGDKTLLFYTPALDPRMSMSVARPGAAQGDPQHTPHTDKLVARKNAAIIKMVSVKDQSDALFLCRKIQVHHLYI